MCADRNHQCLGKGNTSNTFSASCFCLWHQWNAPLHKKNIGYVWGHLNLALLFQLPMEKGLPYSKVLGSSEWPGRSISLTRIPAGWLLPCPIALISTVLGIFSSRFQPEDLRLTWDLKRVFTSVDFPSPLWPENCKEEAYNICHSPRMEADRKNRARMKKCCRYLPVLYRVSFQIG